jgi:glyoxylase-like metal-dependent hydrolase (beta-lactamase superfamily II)
VNADDGIYFRQLLCGRDIARDDPLARQMVNFAYLIGDRATGEAVAIDPAYDIRGLLDVAEADGMRVVGALASHYHPDHVGGDMMGYQISGVRELLALHPVPIQCTPTRRRGSSGSPAPAAPTWCSMTRATWSRSAACASS